MKIFVLFETCEGQTAKIATFVADRSRVLGHDVTMIDTSDKVANASIADADKVILAAPVHERRHPRSFEAAVTAAQQDLAQRPTLMLSVSLKAAFPEGQEEARDYLTEMEMRTGLEPTQEALVAGAIRTGSYDYYQSQIVGHVVLTGHAVTLTEGGKEFTDWEALAATVDGFVTA